MARLYAPSASLILPSSIRLIARLCRHNAVFGSEVEGHAGAALDATANIPIRAAILVVVVISPRQGKDGSRRCKFGRLRPSRPRSRPSGHIPFQRPEEALYLVINKTGGGAVEEPRM